jgi:hypothetical protein
MKEELAGFNSVWRTGDIMVRKRRFLVFGLMAVLAVTILVISGCSQNYSGGEHNYKPKNGYVPDEETAIKIAVAVWIPIYGEKQIEGEKPYRAKLDKGVWTVEGSLLEGWVGGVAVAEIAKDDGCILRVSHGK